LCKPVPAHAASTPASSPPAQKKDPFAERTVYNDNFLDLLFIKIYTKKIAAQLDGVYVPDNPTYDDFVRVSKEIMKGRTPEQQKAVVLDVLRTLLPDYATKLFRDLFPPTKSSAELNALFATLGFKWLVGEMERQRGDIKVGPNEVRPQDSIVKIKKCRYLEASGCVGMCTNVCKMPTQAFFTDDFGLPLTMKPNFEDLSCEMIFGQPPEPKENDEAFKQPCFLNNCDIAKERQLAKEGSPCPKLGSRS